MLDCGFIRSGIFYIPVYIRIFIIEYGRNNPSVFLYANNNPDTKVSTKKQPKKQVQKKAYEKNNRQKGGAENNRKTRYRKQVQKTNTENKLITI